MFSIFVDIKTNEIFDYYSTDTCGTENTGKGCLRKIMENNWEMNY
jgi:hypothetical protein